MLSLVEDVRLQATQCGAGIDGELLDEETAGTP